MTGQSLQVTNRLPYSAAHLNWNHAAREDPTTHERKTPACARHLSLFASDAAASDRLRVPLLSTSPPPLTRPPSASTIPAMGANLKGDPVHRPSDAGSDSLLLEERSRAMRYAAPAARRYGQDAEDQLVS
jgi:hypothetical protein